MCRASVRFRPSSGCVKALSLRLLPAGESVNPKQLRMFLDVPEPKTGSFLILAVKQRQLEVIKILTGSHDTHRIEDSENKIVRMAGANKAGQLGRTALFEACCWGNAEVCANHVCRAS